ncbi:hypothetical protein AVEN_172225-1 [Araneus ventricosus]|uniref:Uncharacterized protein n=1 Tax=Araneus ventricosus TaxID=182803 RepID=A0A4Y2JZD2_ARAVE|nr:hypothetical protein AVEN_172225-1 [Araneus ventricosus]
MSSDRGVGVSDSLPPRETSVLHNGSFDVNSLSKLLSPVDIQRTPIEGGKRRTILKRTKEDRMQKRFLRPEQGRWERVGKDTVLCRHASLTMEQ